MDPLTERQLRASMVNCSRGEATRMPVPRLETVDWAAIDFLGWRDAKAPLRAYVAAWRSGEPMGVALRKADSPRVRKVSAMCSLCRSGRPNGDVALFTAARAGAKGREGNSVGTYICADLACSANARIAKATGDIRPDGTLTVGERVAGLVVRLGGFLDEVVLG